MGICAHLISRQATQLTVAVDEGVCACIYCLALSSRRILIAPLQLGVVVVVVVVEMVLCFK